MTVLCWLCLLMALSQPSLQDSIDDVELMMGIVSPQNCSSLPFQLKILPRHSVIEFESGYAAPIADFQDILYEARKLVISRAMFFSYALQQDVYQPESIYYHLTTFSNLLTNSKIKSSGILFEKNTMKANWLKQKPTLPRYGPYAYQIESNPYYFQIRDIGAIPNTDYLNESFVYPKPWYNSWMSETFPNPKGTQMNVTIIKEDGSSSSLSFIGPPHNPSVKLTEPYYECSKLQDWIVSATSPIVVLFTGEQKSTPVIKYTAIVTADVRYIDIDINPCSGNESANMFAGSAKCKSTTKCKPLGKFGIHRGSYECYCNLGFRYPDRQDGPFLGEEIKNVTSSQYSNPANFNCLKILGSRTLDPSENVELPADSNILRISRLDAVLKLINKVNMLYPMNCSSYAEKIDLGLSNTLLRTIKKQFKSQVYSALRLAHFLSSFLQNFNSSQTNFPGWNNHTVSSELMYGELIAIMVSDSIIKGATIIFEEDILIHKQFFAASIMRSRYNDISNNSVNQMAFNDLIIKHYLSNYSSEDWYQRLKHKKKTPKLYNYTLDLEVFNITNLGLKQSVPLTYVSVSFDYASQANGPLYDCFYNATVIWFDVPFFRLDGNNNAKLAGFVSVAVDAHLIDINQCGDAEDELFRGTNLCDKKSTKCVHTRNSGFQLGGYHCECNPGYEYPYNGSSDYFKGHIMEYEYMKYLEGNDNILNMLKCRKVNSDWALHLLEKSSYPPRKVSITTPSPIEDQKQISKSLIPSATNHFLSFNTNAAMLSFSHFASIVNWIMILVTCYN